MVNNCDSILLSTYKKIIIDDNNYKYKKIIIEESKKVIDDLINNNVHFINTESTIKLYSHMKYGWFDLTQKLIDELNNILKNNSNYYLIISDVKEKYCHLDINFESNNYALFNDIFSKYEPVFEKTCCECGKKGKIIDIKGWTVPLCSKCYKNRIKEQ